MAGAVGPRTFRDPLHGKCARCGSPFVGMRNKRYCSANCKRLLWDQKRRARLRVADGRALHSTPGRTERRCIVCQKTFVGHRDAKYCSRSCGDRFRRPGRADYDRARCRVYYAGNAHRISARRKGKEQRQHAREYMRDYRSRNRDRFKAYQREYRQKNPDKFRKWQRRYDERFRELRREANRRWRKEHPAAHAHVAAARRARELAAPGNHTLSEWLALLERCNFRCTYCGRQSGRLTRDHDVPLIRGGSHGIDNIRPACARCNSKKGRNTGDEFRARLARDARHPEPAA